MPYKMFKDSKGRFCVKNSETGESKGCSDTRKMAVEHMRALYAAEGGAKMGKKDLDELVEKSIADYVAEYPEEATELKELSEKGYVPYGLVTFDELDRYRSAQELTHKTFSLTDDFYGLVWGVMNNTDVLDKAEAVKSLADEYATRVNEIQEDYSQNPDQYGEDEDKALDEEGLEVDCEGCDEGEKAKRSDVSEADKKRAVAEYGKVSYADPTNKKYPIDTEKHIRAAWSYIGMPKNAAKYPDKGAAIKKRIIAAWKRVIDKDGPPQAKESGVWERITDAVKEIIAPLLPSASLDTKEQPGEPESDPEAGSFMIFKDQIGEMHWLASYSNNFRDDDRPSEIIAEKSHRRFEELVDKGQAAMPELWVWHQPEWRFGQATWVAYDDKGFSVAAGDVGKGQEQFAEYLSKCKNVRLSHGMPVASIRRDPENPTVILEHITKEISVLPDFAAANKYTSFALLKEQDDPALEENMAIPQKKIDGLVKAFGEGVQPFLDELVKMNAKNATHASEEGRDTKEKDADATVDAAPEVPVTPVTDAPAQEPAPAKPAEEGDEGFTPEVIAEAFAKTVKPYVDSLEEVRATQTKTLEALETLALAVKSLQEGQESAVKEIVSNTPAASLAAMIARKITASNSPETTVDGRSALAKDKPAEQVAQKTGIEFLDNLISGPTQ